MFTSNIEPSTAWFNAGSKVFTSDPKLNVNSCPLATVDEPLFEEPHPVRTETPSIAAITTEQIFLILLVFIIYSPYLFS